MSDLGDLLRRARAYKRVSLRDAEQATRISRDYLAALEAHDFDNLPPPTYARGIVRNYAQYLGLDPAVVLNLYEIASDEQPAGQDIAVVPAIPPMDMRSTWAPNFAIIGFMLIVSAVLFTWLYSAYFQDEQTQPTGTIVQPTATQLSATLLTRVAETPTVTPTIDPAILDSQATATAEEANIHATISAEETATAPDPVVVPTEPEDSSAAEDTVAGEHEFSIYAYEEVWVEVYLDYSDTASYSDVMSAGSTLTFTAGHLTVGSGDARVVQIYVDGEDWGLLGSEWDAVVTYPW